MHTKPFYLNSIYSRKVQVLSLLVGLNGLFLGFMGCSKPNGQPENSSLTAIDEEVNTKVKRIKPPWADRLKTTFPEAPFTLTDVDVVLNVSGETGGFGDFTGPFFILLDLMKADSAKLFPSKTYAIILDDYTYTDVLKKMYKFSNLAELNARFNVHFISPNQAKGIKTAKYIFEFFSGGRQTFLQTDHPFFGNETLRVVSDTMHIEFAPLDFAETKSGMLLFFQPPGIGPRRSGMVDDPEIEPYLNKTPQQRKTEALKEFGTNSPIHKILTDAKFRDANIGFLYGAHNTVTRKSTYTMRTPPYLKVQTLKALQAIKPENSPDKPLIILTPNSREVFDLALNKDIDTNDRPVDVKNELLTKHTAPEKQNETKIFLDNLSGTVEVLSADQLLQKTVLDKSTTYIVSTGNIAANLFIALMAITTAPVIAEGNSTVSSSIRLHQPFAMYLSLWNWENVNDLIEFEKSCTKTTYYEDTYKKGKAKAPDFDIIFKNLREHPDLTSKLDKCIPSFPKMMKTVLDTANTANAIEKAGGTHLEQKYMDLSMSVLHDDKFLAYSLIYNAVQRGVLKKQSLKSIREKIKSQLGVNYEDLERRMLDLYLRRSDLDPNATKPRDPVKRVRPEIPLQMSSHQGKILNLGQ